MNKVNLYIECLENEELYEVNGGSFAKDAGYVIGYSARWNYEFIKGWIEFLS